MRKYSLKGTSQLSYRVLVSYVLSLLILLATFCWPLSIAESKEKDRGSVKIVVSSLNVREKPGLTHPVIGYVQKNERFIILDLKDNWVQINLKSGYKGWVASWLVEFEQQTAVAAIPLLNVRSGPDISSSIIGQLNKGTSVVVLDRKGDWVQIRTNNLTGWVANWLIVEKKAENEDAFIKILNPGTNIRSGPQTSHDVVFLASEGTTFPVLNREGDWFKIRLPDKQVGYVAGWIVSAHGIPNVERKGVDKILKGKTIMIDPGHGGNDSGAIGPHLGSLEKVINLKVSRLLGSKLKSAGATVYYTRMDDRKIPLDDRISMAVDKQVDAFISIHHNTSENFQVNGVITYFYTNGEDRKLASMIQKELVKRTNLTDLKARYGDYFVLRENPQLAVLVELGFLTNYQEELIVNTGEFQNQAAEGIFQGILQYFKKD